jgi:Domain of unknown function (DUF4332)
VSGPAPSRRRSAARLRTPAPVRGDTPADPGRFRPETEWEPSTGRTLDGDGGSQEVTLHELGESIAADLGAMQNELARYPFSFGSYVVDRMELEVPVGLRVDPLGQMLATVTDGSGDGAGGGTLRFALSPVRGGREEPGPTSGRNVEDLGALSADDLARLRQHRVYGVNDLLRVAERPAGRQALQGLGLSANLDDVLARARVLCLPVLPEPVARVVLSAGVASPEQFQAADPAKLAPLLSKELGQPVEPDDVAQWQADVGDLLRIPRPERPEERVVIRPPQVPSTPDAPRTPETPQGPEGPGDEVPRKPRPRGTANRTARGSPSRPTQRRKR